MQKYKTLDNSAGVGFDLTLLIMLIQEKLLAGLSRVSISLQKYFMVYLLVYLWFIYFIKGRFFAFKDVVPKKNFRWIIKSFKIF